MKRKKQELVSRNQELTTHIALQERFIRDLEKEIYDNVNQVLCLARIKLSGINWNDREGSAETIGQSGDLIVKAIHDLRNLAKQAKRL
jgi:hypothetical protein